MSPVYPMYDLFNHPMLEKGSCHFFDLQSSKQIVLSFVPKLISMNGYMIT